MSELSNLAFRRTKEAIYWSSVLSEPLTVAFFLLRPILSRDLNASNNQLALIIVLKHAIALLSVYGSLWALGKRERLKPQMIWTGIVLRIPFLFFGFVHNAWWALLAIGINMLVGKAGGPAWLEVMRLNLPKEERTRIYALSGIISCVEGLILGYLLKKGMDLYPSCWRIYFPLASALGLVSLWWIWRVTVPPAILQNGEALPKTKESPTLAHFFEFAAKAISQNILQFVSFLALLICAASPFLKFSGTRVIYLYPPSQYIVAFFALASVLQLATWIWKSEFILRPWKTAMRLFKERKDFRNFQLGYFICGGGILLFQPVLSNFCIHELKISKWSALTDIFLIYQTVGFTLSMQLWNRSLRLGLFRASTLLCLSFAVHIGFLVAATFWHGHHILGQSASLFLLYAAQIAYGICLGGSHILWNMSATLFCRPSEDSSIYTTTNMLALGLRAISLPFLGAHLSQQIGYLNLLYISGTCCLVGAAFLAFTRGADDEMSKTLVKN